MKRCICCLYLSVFSFSQIAISQQQSGTIIVFRLSPDHAVVAGDSRTVRSCRPQIGIGPSKKIVSEDVCKVLAFDNKYVFAAAGYTGRFDPCISNRTSWNVREITRRLYTDGGITGVDDFTKKWLVKMGDVLTDDSKISPPLLSSTGLVLAGLFVGNVEHKVTAEAIVFRLTDRGLEASITNFWPIKEFNDFGEDNALTEFRANKTAKSKLWHHRIDPLEPDAQIATLATLDRDNDTSGLVGGRIDSVRITPSEVQWLHVKKQCDSK
jgi:hypothetical protein